LLTLTGFLFVAVDQGHGWGSRYFHSAWLSLPLLATAFLFPPAEDKRSGQPTGSPIAVADPRAYVVACALLSLFAGVGLRASQIDEFLAAHLSHSPHYAGTEPRVVVQSGAGFQARDLVQNDPFLRKDVVRMIRVGRDNTAAAIERHFPGYHRVYVDIYGEVWSAAATSAVVAR
jgi:hypothetical protein